MEHYELSPDEIVYCGDPVVATGIKDLPSRAVETAREMARHNDWAGINVCGYYEMNDGDYGVFASEREEEIT